MQWAFERRCREHGRGYLAIAKQIADGGGITQDDVDFKLIEATRALTKKQSYHRCPAENEGYYIDQVVGNYSSV